MGRGIKIITGFSIVITLFMAFMVWYKIAYSQDVVSSYEVNFLKAEKKILIASQGSKYKETLVNRIISGLKRSSVYIKVMDVTQLTGEDSQNWDAILIISAVEMGKNQKDVVAFISTAKKKSKVIMQNTAGDGEWMDKSTGIDTMTSASPMVDVDKQAEILIGKIETIIK